jgi:hypothetical protein
VLTPVLLATQEVEIGRIEGKKVARSHLNQQSGHGGEHLSFHLQRRVNRRVEGQASLGIKVRPSSKNNKSK